MSLSVQINEHGAVMREGSSEHTITDATSRLGAGNPLFTTRDKCPVCSGTELASLYKRSFRDPRMQEYLRLEYQGHMETEPLAGLDYEIVECRACGFLFQRHVPNEEGTRRLFDVWLNPRVVEESSYGYRFDRHWARAAISFAARCTGRPRLRMLDYGACIGDMCCFARDLGHDVSAVEIPGPYAEVLRKRGFEPLLPGQEEAGYYDFVVCIQVIEHLPEPLPILQALRRTMSDDGLLLLGVHNCRKVRRMLKAVDGLPIEQYKDALEPCAPVQHMNCFTNRTLKQLCRRAGFQPVFRPFMSLRAGVAWGNPKRIPKDIVRPFYRHFLGTSQFLRKTT